MSNEIALDVTCSDAEACAAMAADPLIRHVATPRWFNEGARHPGASARVGHLAEGPHLHARPG
jgi:hypothetical protein